jgi:chitin disaccharide deacetylase
MSRFKIIIVIFSMTIGYASIAQQKSILERLGYPKETKLLIIHADDMGVSHSENMATIHAIEKGVVTSASIMVPCPWFPEVAEYAKSHPDVDLGLHLTLTSEWKNYRWGPVTSSDKVQSLLDEHGYFNGTTGALMKNGKAVEVEKELRAQIERAIKFGIDPTHFDAHMAGSVSTPEFLKAYIALGHEYKVPVLLSKEVGKLFNINLADYVTEKDILIEKFVMATYETYRLGMDNYYTEQIKAMTPGLNVILLHAAYNDAEMKAITVGHNDYGANWRQDDVDFFTSEKCKKLLLDEKIKLITWREIRDKLFR